MRIYVSNLFVKGGRRVEYSQPRLRFIFQIPCGCYLDIFRIPTTYLEAFSRAHTVRVCTNVRK